MVSDSKKVSPIEPAAYELDSGERFSVRLFRPEDAPGIGRLFHAVYGGEYPVKLFYDPQKLLEAQEKGENYSIVAGKENGDIIGHMGLFRSSPYPDLYETGAGLVLPGYRNAGINLKLFDYIYEKVAPELRMEEVWGEAVCNHLHSQKAVLNRHKHVETGLEVDLMPGEAYSKEKNTSGRVASLLVFRSYVARPHTVYLPRRYEDTLRFLYSRLDDRREFDVALARPAAGIASHASTQIFEFARVCRIAVTAIGEDFDSYFGALESEVMSAGIVVIQVWVNLACPWAEHAVEVLRGKGFFLGGILPRWFDDDGLLMQKIVGRPNWEEIRLFSDRSLEIFSILKKDWEDVCSI